MCAQQAAENFAWRQAVIDNIFHPHISGLYVISGFIASTGFD